MWFADSEETSVTNAVQVLSNTEGRDNHVIQQVGILLRELCRLHAVPEPPDIDRLTIPTSGSLASITSHSQDMSSAHRLSADIEQMDTDSGTGDNDPASADDDDDDEEEDSDEDGDVEEDLQLDMEEVAPRTKHDEMGVEHLATLERLRQNQRRDYLKVCKVQVLRRSSPTFL